MTGTAKLRSRATATVWREALPQGVHERQRWFAARAAALLTVILRAHPDNTVVTANVVAERHACASRFVTPGDTRVRTQNAQIAVAKAWTEKAADEIAAGATR